MGQTLANHSYVDLSITVGDYNVVCHTDLVTCCSCGQGIPRGDWYSPNGTRLPFSGYDNQISEARGPQRVEICQFTGRPPTGPTGIYRCDIPTIAVHDNTDISVRDTVYVCLYTSNELIFFNRRCDNTWRYNSYCAL